VPAAEEQQHKEPHQGKDKYHTKGDAKERWQHPDGGIDIVAESRSNEDKAQGKRQHCHNGPECPFENAAQKATALLRLFALFLVVSFRQNISLIRREDTPFFHNEQKNEVFSAEKFGKDGKNAFLCTINGNSRIIPNPFWGTNTPHNDTR
jgi:hypothetical protein